MTEEEAKTKRCCGPYDAGLAVLRSETVEIMRDEKTVDRLEQHITVKDRMCAGAACMAWRWNYISYVLPDTGEPSISAKIVHGHCGLAGRP